MATTSTVTWTAAATTFLQGVPAGYAVPAGTVAVTTVLVAEEPFQGKQAGALLVCDLVFCNDWQLVCYARASKAVRGSHDGSSHFGSDASLALAEQQ